MNIDTKTHHAFKPDEQGSVGPSSFCKDSQPFLLAQLGPLVAKKNCFRAVNSLDGTLDVYVEIINHDKIQHLNITFGNVGVFIEIIDPKSPTPFFVVLVFV
jgi:hypothetical protein